MNESAERRLLMLGRECIAYRLHRSRRRTLEISVAAGGLVEVRAPADPSIERIEQRLRARVAWIRRTVASRLTVCGDSPRRFVSGESHRYLGRQYRLKVAAGDGVRVQLVDGRLRVEVRDPGESTQVRRAVVAWFAERARKVIPQRVALMTSSPRFAGLEPSAVSVRAMTNRWGSCSAAGRLMLNTRLIALPTALVDYVIAHELCHLRVAKHGPRFERLLERVMPDWRERHERLVGEGAGTAP